MRALVFMATALLGLWPDLAWAADHNKDMAALIHKQLKANSRLADCEFIVQFSDGTAVLEGCVISSQQAAEAIAIARSLTGVRQVINILKVHQVGVLPASAWQGLAAPNTQAPKQVDSAPSPLTIPAHPVLRPAASWQEAKPSAILPVAQPISEEQTCLRADSLQIRRLPVPPASDVLFPFASSGSASRETNESDGERPFGPGAPTAARNEPHRGSNAPMESATFELPPLSRSSEHLRPSPATPQPVTGVPFTEGPSGPAEAIWPSSPVEAVPREVMPGMMHAAPCVGPDCAGPRPTGWPSVGKAMDNRCSPWMRKLQWWPPAPPCPISRFTHIGSHWGFYPTCWRQWPPCAPYCPPPVPPEAYLPGAEEIAPGTTAGPAGREPAPGELLPPPLQQPPNGEPKNLRPPPNGTGKMPR